MTNEEELGVNLTVAVKEDMFPVAIDNVDSHDKLVVYLTTRLDEGKTERSARLSRYESIDKAVSNWVVLSEADAKRKEKELATGEGQAIQHNMPLIHSYIDDLVAFYAGVYSPVSGSFFQIPEDMQEAQEGDKLVEKLNQDAKEHKYYKQLCAFLRSTLKYNMGGFHLIWDDDRNQAESLDMYNFMWDALISDPSDIPKQGEWAAKLGLESRLSLYKKEKAQTYNGVGRVLEASEGTAAYYRTPPTSAGLTEGAESSEQSWSSFGASLTSDSSVPITGHEVITMYCWVNPKMFDLGEEGLELWKFVLVDGKHIVAANRHTERELGAEIPFYCGFLNQDDMKAAQKSVSEQLMPTQSFINFLLNVFVSAMRGNVWGITGYDPKMFDMSQVKAGSTSARVPSKQPGRDVRSGMINMSQKADVGDVMPAMERIMQLTQQMFPSQAMPSQVAGIDRAVKSQVASVMQGANRRLHMHVQVMDADIMGPLNLAQFKNIVDNKPEVSSGLTDDIAIRILGTGILQLNREAAEESVKQILFALIQNPDSIQQLDVMKLFTYWGNLQNLGVNLADFTKEQPAAEGPAQGMPTQQLQGMGSQ